MGTIKLTTKIFPLGWLLLLFPAYAQVDSEEPIKVGWSTRELPVSAGAHTLSVYFPYLFGLMPRAGLNQVQVTVGEGETVAVRYRAPWLVFLKGKITVG